MLHLVGAASAALAPCPGERVLDIGCGGGETALELARAVAPDGTVGGRGSVGSGARVRAARGHRGCDRVPGGPSGHPGVPIRAGLVRRRFLEVWGNVFTDPTAAFSNIRRSLRSNGQLRVRLLAGAGKESARHPAAQGRVRSFAAAARSRPGRARPIRFRQPRPRARHSRRGGVRETSRLRPMTSRLEAAISMRCSISRPSAD